MIVLNKEMAFLSLYLAEKEYFLNDTLREALNFINYLINRKNIDKALAIHLTNEKYKKKYNVDYSKEYLWKLYNTRLAHIKNGKDKFKLWGLEIRERQYGIKKKLCECGCGNEVANKKNRFVRGHNIKMRTKEEKDFWTQNMLIKREQNDKVIKVDFNRST